MLLLNIATKTFAVYSIQCCTGGDNTCSSKPVDCPSNTCFKLSKYLFNKKIGFLLK